MADTERSIFSQEVRSTLCGAGVVSSEEVSPIALYVGFSMSHRMW